MVDDFVERSQVSHFEYFNLVIEFVKHLSSPPFFQCLLISIVYDNDVFVKCNVDNQDNS